MPRLAPSFPYHAIEPANGLIHIVDSAGGDVCFIPVEGSSSLRTERTVEWIEQCSSLMTDYVQMEPLGVVAAVRRIAQLAIVLFSTVGISAGLYASVWL